MTQRGREGGRAYAERKEGLVDMLYAPEREGLVDMLYAPPLPLLLRLFSGVGSKPSMPLSGGAPIRPQ